MRHFRNPSNMRSWETIRTEVMVTVMRVHVPWSFYRRLRIRRDMSIRSASRHRVHVRLPFIIRTKNCRIFFFFYSCVVFRTRRGLGGIRYFGMNRMHVFEHGIQVQHTKRVFRKGAPNLHEVRRRSSALPGACTKSDQRLFGRPDAPLARGHF